MGYYDTQTVVRGSAPQMDIGALLKAGSSISGALGSIREGELADAEYAQKKKLFDQQQVEYDRKLAEREATDLFNQELLKGKQAHGGILNTDALIAEADKNAFTAEEIVKYDTYKGDEAAARKAGDTALADKIAWQARLSDFADSGNDKLSESRVQMLERVLGNVSSKGLPVPAELVAGMEQARLAEETVNKEARKDIDERIGKLTESLNKDQKWAIGSLGTSQYTDDDGVTHNIGGNNTSTASAIKANNTNVGQGNKLLMAAVDGLNLTDKDAKLDATAKALELTSVLKEQGIPFDDAAAIIANGMYSKEQNPVLSLVGLGKKGPAINQEAIDLYASNALKQYQQTVSGTTGNSTSSVRGPSEKALAAVDYYNTQASNVSNQLARLNKEKALLEGTAEDRQTAALDRLLQSKGILESPEASLSKELASKAQFNAKDLKDSEKIYNTGQGYSDPKTIVEKIAKVETGGIKGDTYSAVHPSGALGRYGFVPSTAVEEMQKAGYKGTKEELLSQFISKPSIQDKLMNNYVNFNTSILEKNGVPVTDWTIWTAHNLGAGNAIKLSKGIVDDAVISAISKNLPEGVKPSVENYQKQWYSKINVGDESKEYIKKVESATSNSSIVKDLFSKVDEGKELVGKSDVISEYKNKRDEQEKELSSSLYARTFGPKTEAGEYAKIWEESDSKKGSTLNKNISSLAAAMRKDGIETYDDVAALYQSMPKGPDRDAVGEVLNYKGMQNSQEWRDAKVKEQYIEAGLAALSAIPGVGKGAKEVIAQPIKKAVQDKAEAAIFKKVGESPLALPNFSTGNSTWVNKNAIVATDKLNGVNLSKALEKSAPDSALINSLNSASIAKKGLETTAPTNVANLNYFRLTKELDKLKKETDASMLLKGAIEAQKNGQITKEQLTQIMRDISDKGTINTKKLMEELPK